MVELRIFAFFSVIMLGITGNPSYLMKQAYHNIDVFNPPDFEELAKSFLTKFGGAMANSEGECKTALISMLANPMGSPHTMGFLLYSGKKVYDLGNYIECKKTVESYYVMAGVNLTFPFIKIGLCLPKICTPDQLEIFKPYVVDLVEPLIGYKIDLDRVVFMDVKAYNASYSGLSAGLFTFFSSLD